MGILPPVAGYCLQSNKFLRNRLLLDFTVQDHLTDELFECLVLPVIQEKMSSFEINVIEINRNDEHSQFLAV